MLSSTLVILVLPRAEKISWQLPSPESRAALTANDCELPEQIPLLPNSG